MKIEKLEKYVSLTQGLVVNKSTTSLFSNSMDEDHPYPLLRIVDFEKGNHTSYSKYVSKSVPQKNLVIESDILFTRVTCQCFRGFRGVFHNNLFRVDLISDELTSDYLYVALQSLFVKKQALKFTTSSVVPDLSHDKFKEIAIPVPSLDIQDTIVATYSDLQSKIENNNTICSELESMAKLLYDYWFVQFEYPDENGQPYKSSGGKMVWNEELKREIPEGWHVSALSDYCCFENGDRGANYPSGNDFIAEGIPFVSGGAMKEDAFDYDAIRYISEGKYNALRSGKADKGDILMTLRGSLTKCLYSPFDRMAIASALVIVRPRNGLTKEYLHRVLISDYYIQLLENYDNGSVQANLSVDTIKHFPVIVPKGEVLNSFSKRIQLLESTENTMKEENQHLISLRNFLLPMLMNGQVKVG